MVGSAFHGLGKAQSGTIKIGFVSPRTGPLAAFAQPDDFTLEQVRKATGGKVRVGGKTYNLEIVYKDSQSNPNRAAEVTAELILKDRVHLVVAGNTPETTVPVADQCELNGIPCITDDTPWQPYFFSRGGVVSRVMCKSLCTGGIPLLKHLLQHLLHLREPL
ncbi:putative substrate-binding component of ABC transporter [Thermus thermophilus]|uniref:ABC transporter substrate-binding protein n=1 Tax=Thermus thermophilus TaxID=274 RepID=UPI00090C35D0|nr:putative substrate-binding component of ABC transporter [Thermus thermophilus]BDB11271.1 hypothetical protein TthTMY_10100 [Thermus thermophilus]